MIKNLFYKLLQLIDDKRFLIKPLKWFYYFKGGLPFIFPLLFIIAIIESEAIHFYSTWAEIVAWVFIVLFTLFLLFIAYINFLFWFDRARQLETIVRPGDSIVAIPLLADNIKNNGESFAILLSSSIIVGAVFFYLFLLLTGEGDIYRRGHFLIALLIIIVLTALCAMIAYFIILFTHFVAEKLRMRAQMCNDLRDVADIHRAATMENETDVTISKNLG